jgi:large subunit ribosomal protein L15
MTKYLQKKLVVKSRKRVGRGISAGGGKTAGRGTKGQKSRAGHNIPNRFEGGQTPLSMRMPKLRGFSRRSSKPKIIRLNQLDVVKGDELTDKSLSDVGLIKAFEKYKILANGKTKKAFSSIDVPVSKNVRSILSKNKIVEVKKTSGDSK